MQNWTQKTSKHQERKLKAICLEITKCKTKQTKNKWAERVKKRITVCDLTIRNGMNEMGFAHRKDKQKPALTLKLKRTRLHWTQEKHDGVAD